MFFNENLVEKQETNRFWDKSHIIPVYVYDFEEDDKCLNIISILDNLLNGSVKIDYWDGEYHQNKAKNMKEAKKHIKNRKLNFLNFEVNKKMIKDDGKVKKIYGTLFLSPLNNCWNKLKYLKCKKKGNEDVRLSLLQKENFYSCINTENQNNYPTYMVITVEFSDNISEENALNLIKKAIMRNSNQSLNKFTTVYAGSIDGENMGIDEDIFANDIEDKSLLKDTFALPYPIMVGPKENFNSELLESNLKGCDLKTKSNNFYLLDVLEDMELIQRRYKDSFLNLNEEIQEFVENL